ncbi:cell division protein FtsQ/DivIB [Reichenbachiella versicolor]|uniref:cell division protein FtsQ/DivIB n=1 Tax=Reichenbachiella versicolor TaxID=1821036 RepID=UPI000D6E1112|nr:cell division protein FtsQ [Reichenbachiella versicolor]
MKSIKNILSSSKYGLALFGLMILIGFGNARLKERFITDITINVDNQFENYFIDQSDVMELLNQEGQDYLLNSNLGALNLKEVEERIENHQFVDDAQAFVDIHGALSIEVKQNRPIARIVNGKGEDYYVSTDGEILPESSHYTARVLLVMLENEYWIDEYNIRDSEEGEEIFKMIQYIVDHKFWNPQIAMMVIKKNLEIELQPQVTKQIVEFGKAEDVEKKFRKLMAFYKSILPYKGWNTYERVSLKFKDQIVCKK